MARKNKKKGQLAGCTSKWAVSEQPSVWWPPQMDMPSWKKLLFLLSQGMNQNRNPTLKQVLCNFLHLERRKPISLCRQGFVHTQASRAANNNPTVSRFQAPRIIVTCSKISIKKNNLTSGCLEKSSLSAPLGTGWCWQASNALFISNIYISMSLHM